MEDLTLPLFQRVNCSARMAGSTAPAVFDDLILHIAPDKFYLESLSSTQSVLVIDRITYEISLQVKLKHKYIFLKRLGLLILRLSPYSF